MDFGEFGHFDSGNPLCVATAAVTALFLAMIVFPKLRAVVFGFVDPIVESVKRFFYDPHVPPPPAPQLSAADLAAAVAEGVKAAMQNKTEVKP